MFCTQEHMQPHKLRSFNEHKLLNKTVHIITLIIIHVFWITGARSSQILFYVIANADLLYQAENKVRIAVSAQIV